MSFEIKLTINTEGEVDPNVVVASISQAIEVRKVLGGLSGQGSEGYVTSVTAELVDPEATRKLEPGRYEVTLEDLGNGPEVNAEVLVSLDCVALRVDGYGELTSVDGEGWPVMAEVYDGDFRVLLWTDINEEEPTFTFSMEDAKESLRKPEEEEA